MNKTEPTLKQTWTGTHLGFTYESIHRGVDQGMNEGKGVWNYYIYLYESKTPDFDKLWLEPHLLKITPESTGFITYDYNELPIANIYWHGGVTYYSKHGEVPGYRTVQFGCDFNHLYDQEYGFDYTLEDVLQEVFRTCRELQELYPNPPHKELSSPQ